VRSVIEMGHLLEAVRAAGDAVTAEAGESMFLSRVLKVDADEGSMVLACSDHKPANRALLLERAVTFRISHRSRHVEFLCRGLHEVMLEGTAAIQAAFPVAIVVRQRRDHARYKVPARLSLLCEISAGALSFDAEVVDVSLGGIGTVLYEADIRLEPGMRFHRVRIRHPQRPPVLVDLEVRHVARVMRPEGRPAYHAGCRIIGGARDLEDLVKLFVTELSA
jgi:c-di-GMP-binding flagellar brake protein YcgR